MRKFACVYPGDFTPTCDNDVDEDEDAYEEEENYEE